MFEDRRLSFDSVAEAEVREAVGADRVVVSVATAVVVCDRV